MEALKHTPGPWVCSHNDFWHKDESNLGQFFVAVPVPSAAYDSGFGQQIAWLARSPFLGNTDSHKAFNAEAEANASLIAAAPDMLEALKGAEQSLAQLCVDQHPDNVCCHHLRAVRAAIAKAEGCI